jgi:hypothetical protein
MKKLIFVLTIFVLCVSGCLSGSGSYQANYDFSNIDKIAVIAVEGQVQNENAKNQISNLFVMELLNKDYAPISLAQSKAKVQELIDMGEIAEPAQDAYLQMGQALKVPAVLIINIPYFEEEAFITAQLIDTKTTDTGGSVLWMDQASGKSGFQNDSASNGFGVTQEDYLMDPLLMAQVPVGVTPDQETPAGPGKRALTPRELQKIQYIVAKICSSLPSAGTNKAAPANIIKTKPRRTTTSNW